MFISYRSTHRNFKLQPKCTQGSSAGESVVAFAERTNLCSAIASPADIALEGTGPGVNSHLNRLLVYIDNLNRYRPLFNENQSFQLGQAPPQGQISCVFLEEDLTFISVQRFGRAHSKAHTKPLHVTSKLFKELLRISKQQLYGVSTLQGVV